MRLLKPRMSLRWALPLVAAALTVAPAAGARAPGPAPPAAGAQSAPAPGLNLRQSLSAGPARHSPGLRSAAPSPKALAAAVQQTSGLAASQVVAENVCPAPKPGQAQCAAQVLVRRSDHAQVHPHVVARPTFTQVFPHSRARGAAAALATPSTGFALAPSAGAPAYLQQAYDLTYLSQTAGGSDTIAIVDNGDDPNAASDLATYRTNYGLPACTVANGCFRKVNQSGTASPLPVNAGPAWEQEESLDLDAVSALCPNCHILLVEANSANESDLDAGIAAAVSLGANQITASWVGAGSSPVGVGSFPGATIIAASGDHGYPGGGVDNYPAAFPGVTAAGGTTLSGAGNAGSTRGYDESAWSLNSSGTGWGGGSGCDLHETKPSYQADTGCPGRAYADVSADANPDTGLRVYDSGAGGWSVVGGTSLASPLVAAFEAVTGVSGTSAQWAYSDSALLNDPVIGSSGTCATAIAYICTAGTGYDGPTGSGSISGAIVSGAPGIGGPAIGGGSNNTYTQTVSATTAALSGGVYPNGLDTTSFWQYGPSTAYGQQTTSTDVGSGSAPVAASAALAGLAPNTTYHYRLVAQNGDGTTYGYDYTLATASIGNTAPVNTVAPVIGGSALQGQTLSVSTGTWSPTASSYAYQWQSSADGGSTWASISGGTGSSYTLAGGDRGAEIKVVVSATNLYGSNVATSAATGPVGSGAPVAGSAPVVTGSPDQGQILSAVATWNPTGTSYSYQWQRSGDGGATWSDISGATSPSYTLVVADLGTQVRVTVTAVNPFGQASASSGATAPVQSNAPLNSSAPTVSGADQRSVTLTATTGTWIGSSLSYSYQWQHSADGTTWVNISGAIKPTYGLSLTDEGDAVRVLVSATNVYGISSTPSAATPIVAPFPPAAGVAPTVTGTAQRGSALLASQGIWTGAGNTYTYQWQRDFGEGYVNIPGATSGVYMLALADEGAAVRVVVTATNPDATIAQASAPTAMVTAAIPVDQSAPTIAGGVVRTSNLVANVGSWSGVGNIYAYQWQRSSDGGSTWTGIGGATGIAYLVGVPDEGSELRVQITTTNSDGTAAAISAATVPVPSAPPVSTSAPVLAGSAQRGMILNSSQGAWAGPGNSYAYQWQRSGNGTTWTNIAGAITATYMLGVADEGDLVRAVVTAANPDGTVSAPSQPTTIVQATPPADTTLPVIAGVALRSTNLSASVGAWGGINNTYTCRWQRSADGGTTWTDIAGAGAWSYSVAVADEGAELRAMITATNADGTASAATAATAMIVAAPPVSTSAPTLAGAALRGTVLNSTLGGWAGIGNAYSYQWQRSADGTTWTSIAGANTFSYALAVGDEGDQVRVQVTAANSDATVSAASAATPTVAAAPPANTAAPALSGSVQRGLTLASSLGSWNGIGNVYSFQWQRSPDGTAWTNIAGATSPSYKLAVADEGDAVRLVITGTNADAGTSAPSAPSTTVAATPPVDTTVPTLSGIVARGQALISTQGTWLGVGNIYAYQWQSSTDNTTWTSIPGATNATYGLGAGDEGTALRLMLTASNADGSSSATSAPTTVVPSAAPVNTTAPTISGTAQRGFMLSSTPGTWSGIGNSLAYQWQRSTDNGSTWTNIAAANNTTYGLGLGDEGALVRVMVIMANPDGTVGAPSAATATVTGSPPANAGTPTTAGIARRGNTLSSTAGVWSGSGNVLALQWQRSADGTTWTSIAGSTSSTYTLVPADEGDNVRLLVTAVNPDGTALAASAGTPAVTTAPPVNSAVPIIAGTVKRTFVLTASSGTWSGIGNSLAYQWQRSADTGATWTNIANAITSAYTVATADEGDNVRVVVTATNPDGSVATASAATATVQAAPPSSTQIPAVTGNPRLGATLSTDNGQWNPPAVSYTYVWQRGDSINGFQAIAGATGATYTLAPADVSETVRVVVTAVNPDGSTAATSDATATIAAPPANLTAPAAPSGTAMNGYPLTADTGTWDSPVTYTFSWERCAVDATAVTTACVTVSNAPIYTLQASDIGFTIGLTVTATSSGGATSVNSALTGVVLGRPLVNTTAPSIGGNPQVPNTLYGNPGTWTVPPTSVNYTWMRCDADGVSACVTVAPDTAHYALTAADRGHAVVLVADVGSPGRTATAQSPPLTIQDQPLPQATIMPTVYGTTTRTYTMSATGGSWSNNPTSLSYQWERCDGTGHNCAQIPGATETTYQLTTADEGRTMTVAVSAANSSGANTATATPSGQVAPLLPAVTHQPVLSAAGVQQGTAVSVSGAAWQTTSESSYATNWQRCNASGASCQTINGAAQSNYMPTAADVGHTVVAIITATNADGSAQAATAPSDVVLPAAPRWRDLPILTATNGDVGGVITVTPGVWTGPVVTSHTTELMRCTSTCVSVSSAAQYTLVPADVGAILRLRETDGNAGGTTVVWSAQYVGPVASAGSASAVLTSGQAILRTENGDELATALVTSTAIVSTHALVGGALPRGAGPVRQMTVRRAPHVRGKLRAWICPVSSVRGTAPAPCTRQITLGASARVTLPAAMTGRVRVVVVRRGR
jgi:hypothetical protein